MELRFILRGGLAGLIGGLLAFVFARIFAEPQVQAAIDYESGRDEAQQALDQAAGLPVGGAGEEMFSRAVQSTTGLGVGIVGFGLAMGLLVAVVYMASLGRVGALRSRTLALLVAGGGMLCLYLVPIIKYPPNPPAVGNGHTIEQRAGLFLIMLVGSLVFLAGAIWLGRRLQHRIGNWNATLVAGAAFAVLAGLLMAILPPLGHLAANVAVNGVRGSEVPLPLRDPNGGIVYPGFPADVLAEFRINSLLAQVILWGTIGVVFGALAERLLGPVRARAASAPAQPATIGE